MYILSFSAMIYFSTMANKKKTKSLVLSSMILLAGILLILAMPWTDIIRTNPFLNELFNQRISTDTWSIRMEYNLFALQVIRGNPLGLGIYGAEYTRQAYFYALPFNRNSETLQLVPYVVHNSFLAAGVKYGWLGLISFFAFFINILIHYFRAYRDYSKERMASIIMVMAYVFLSMTQDLTFAVELQSLLMLSVILGVYACQEKVVLLNTTKNKGTLIRPYAVH